MRKKISFNIFMLLIFGGLFSCGIYTLEGTLNAPYNISISSNYLYFYGDNSESYFIGYNIWYRENESENYLLAYYKNNGIESIKPTIRKDMAVYDGSGPNEISLSNLYPQDSDKSFYEIYQSDKTKRFYFAASSYGENGEESEKVEFPRWPN